MTEERDLMGWHAASKKTDRHTVRKNKVSGWLYYFLCPPTSPRRPLSANRRRKMTAKSRVLIIFVENIHRIAAKEPPIKSTAREDSCRNDFISI